MPDSGAIVLAGAALVSLGAALFLARRRLSRFEERKNRLRAYVRDQSKVIRQLARESLQLRRIGRRLEGESEQLVTFAAGLEARIAAAEKVDRRLYVLDDRRGRDDQTWIITVRHPNYKGHVRPEASADLSMSWMTGRRYVVWATDKDRALDKIAARLPKEKGFVVTAVTPQGQPP